ncbi:MAG: hypothetical protein WD602_10555 [Actinomycetota bacterium]
MACGPSKEVGTGGGLGLAGTGGGVGLGSGLGLEGGLGDTAGEGSRPGELAGLGPSVAGAAQELISKTAIKAPRR